MNCFPVLFALFVCTFIIQPVWAKDGCLDLVVENQLESGHYLIVFTMKNVSGEVIFEQANLLPWQADSDVFSARLVSKPNTEIDFRMENSVVETEQIIALFPWEIMVEKVRLDEKFADVSEKLSQEDLFLYWKYKPHEKCKPQQGMVQYENQKPEEGENQNE